MGSGDDCHLPCGFAVHPGNQGRHWRQIRFRVPEITSGRTRDKTGSTTAASTVMKPLTTPEVHLAQVMLGLQEE